MALRSRRLPHYRSAVSAQVNARTLKSIADAVFVNILTLSKVLTPLKSQLGKSQMFA
jgi:hypothetical protein